MTTNANKPAYPFTGCGDEGLTKREYFAAMASLNGVEFATLDQLALFIGRDVDAKDTFDIIKANAEADAKLRVLHADALLAELEKQNDN